MTRRHPLYQLLPALEREARAARLDLRPLGGAALHALVGRYALAEGDAQRLVAWLTGRAEGNPFFTAQLLRALEEEGALRQAANGWALGDLGAVGLPWHGPLPVTDELTGDTYTWEGNRPYVRLDPAAGQVAHVLTFGT